MSRVVASEIDRKHKQKNKKKNKKRYYKPVVFKVLFYTVNLNRKSLF